MKHLSIQPMALALSTLLALAPPLPAAESSALEIARQLNEAFVEVSDRVSQSVVVIRVAHKPDHPELDEEENPFFDLLPKEFKKRFREQQEEKQRKDRSGRKEPVFDGQGSGVVIREEGYLLTNRHVVDGADKIKVRFKDGSEFDAEVRGVDEKSDMAVIKIDPKGKKLVAAKLGDSAKVRVGEFAIAIGAPFDLDYSVTVGHVSAKGRSRIIQDMAMDQDFIQTDASINPGNSGGPLVNIAGEVIGINTLIRGMRTGIGFAVPVNLAREVSDQLISEGRFTRAWLGVAIAGLREDAELRDLITGVAEGVVVRQIQPDGPASKSDLKPSDVITAVDGQPVATSQQLKNEIRSKKVGQSVTLDVFRKDKAIKVKVKPEAWPDDTMPAINKRAVREEDTVRTFGLTVQTPSKELLEQFGVEKAAGVIVTEVEKNSEAERKGLKPGDFITEVNQKAVSTPKQFRDALKNADPKKGVILNFTSRGTSKFEILKDSGE